MPAMRSGATFDDAAQAMAEAPSRPKRALIEAEPEAEVPSHLHVTPRRALVESAPRQVVQPPLLTPEQLRNLERARRGAPVRALLDRLLDGFDGSARRALIEPDELLATELVRLAKMDPRWGFLQSVNVREHGAEMDHWVIGPGGIYLLTAKHHPGSRLYVAGDHFLVDGKDAPYVPETRDGASLSAERLAQTSRQDIDVRGVIVPINDRKLTVDLAPYAVDVVDTPGLANWLVNRPEELREGQVMAAFNAARALTSWGPRFSED